MTKEEKIIFDCINKTKAEDTIFYDVRGINPLCDSIIICTALNNRNLNGLKDAIEECCEINNIVINHIEGRDCKSGWLLIDLNDIIIHIMTKEIRDQLNLDEIIHSN